MNQTSLIGIVLVLAAALAASTPLDDYVAAPDSSYSYSVDRTFRGNGYTVYVVNMTSQTWLSSSLVSRSVWTHWLSICVPDVVRPSNAALLLISGGSSSAAEPPSSLPIYAQAVCTQSRTISATLTQVPNQPIVFTGDPRRLSRVEDAILAFTWRHFFEDPSQPFWLGHLPMTKSAVRAMDTITAVVANRSSHRVSEFIVTGLSKRGWTTHLTAAVDRRVKAIIPIVIPILNMQENMNEMFRVYGEWSFAFNDYTQEQVTRYLNTPSFPPLAAIIDPLSYRDRLTMPKYIINAAGDEFFLPTSANMFYSKLDGPTYLRTVPNVEHSLNGAQDDVASSMATFVTMHIENSNLPIVAWQLFKSNATNARIVVTIPPGHGFSLVSVIAYTATTPASTSKRDFRLRTCPSESCRQNITWAAEALVEQGVGTYLVSRDAPARGWTAFFIEATLEYNYPQDPSLRFRRLRITTETNVVPDTLPFPSCGSRC